MCARHGKEAAGPCFGSHSLCLHAACLFAATHGCRNQLEQLPTEVLYDPSLMRASHVACAKCGSPGGVIIQGKMEASDDKLTLFIVCSNESCLHKWQQ
ncbi:hypothetical protein EON67_02430 [archaeon]|nr:MAG: hypothetical protein EON67_02430 [archaeon]